MAFSLEPTKTVKPVSIDHITVILQTSTAGEESIKGQFEIILDDGTKKTVQYPLAAHLTAAQITQLRSFVAMIRTKANTEILGR